MKRRRQRGNITETLVNITRAKQLAQRAGLDQTHPDRYIAPLTRSEQDHWDDLLGKIE